MFTSTILLPYLGCISYLAFPIFASVLPVLVTRADPFQSRLLDVPTTFLSENNGVWQLIDADGDGTPDLCYIKTSNTGSNKVEVHIASASSQFKTRIFEAETTFALENTGTWLLVPARSGKKPDLAFIKTINTGNNKVEVHIASGASDYKRRTQETSTVFGAENNGIWKLYDYNGNGILDLVYIKTSSTGTGKVEVHVAAGPSYSAFTLQTGTTFVTETDGFWELAPYSSRGAADLVFLKDQNAGTGQTEVHVASKSSGYMTRVFEAGSTFAQESNGVWSLMDFNGDGKADLTYIKYQNTGSGTVEVHVAAG